MLIRCKVTTFSFLMQRQLILFLLQYVDYYLFVEKKLLFIVVYSPCKYNNFFIQLIFFYLYPLFVSFLELVN